MTIKELQELEKKTTQGTWIVRTIDGEDCFLERPRKPGEAYGREIMSDEDYETKAADAQFIAACKEYFADLNKIVK